MQIKTKEYLEEALKRIWLEHQSLVKDRNFLYSESIDTNALLFVGINPSYSDDAAQQTSYRLEKESIKLPYFKKFSEIAAYCGTDWTHIDLLFLRETNQELIYPILKQNEGVSFIWKQLELADKLIKMAEPKIIIVSNALAAVFLGKEKDVINNQNIWLNYEFTFDDEIGTHRWNKIPVFFCSMLTGQRALDKGSYQRLLWQIKRTLQIETSRSTNAVT